MARVSPEAHFSCNFRHREPGLMETDADSQCADVIPTPGAWLGPRVGVQEDGLTAIWGLQVLMGREAGD